MTNKQIVHIENMTKKYGDKLVLHDINFDIDSGKFIAFVGESGGGKSTLLRLISGLEAPTTGHVFVNGEVINGFSKVTRMMFQDDRLLPWMTVLDNVSFKSRHVDKKIKAQKLLDLVQLHDFADYFPNQLSGGQKQRVALARALMSSPQMLLLDEPLGALDALTRVRMQELIGRIVTKEKLTTILITHDVSEAVKMADYVVAIKHGTTGLQVVGQRHSHDAVAAIAVADQVQNYILAD